MSIEFDTKLMQQYHSPNRKLRIKESDYMTAKNEFASTSSFLSNLTGGSQQATSTTSGSNNFTKSVLLSKLTFNISRGHYNFVCELLRTKSETRQRINLEPDAANEIVTNQKLWLQFETNKLNKKFLESKTPLILCTYIKETEWALLISRLLVENGAYMSLKNAINGCGPLHYACALLKPELVQLYLRHLTTNLQSTRDFNGNTPLVYLIVSFYFYYKRVNLVNNMSKTYRKKKKLELTLSNDGMTKISENVEAALANQSANDLMEVNFQHRIEQNNKFFQLKCVEALRAYLDQLRKANGGVNTVNRLGSTVQDFYVNIVNSCPDIEKHEFFKVLRRALVDESQMTNLKNSQFFKLPSLYNDQSSKLNAFRSSIHQETDSFLYESSTFSGPTGNSADQLTSFFKSNLLIDLSDMKNCKVIVHSKKNDDNLSYLYTNKRVPEWDDKPGEPFIDDLKSSGTDRYHPLFTLHPPPPRQPLTASPPLQLPRILIDNESLSSDTSSSNNTLTRMVNANETWRDRFNQFYNHLEVNNSDSYRKSYKVQFSPSSTTPTLPNLNQSMVKNKRSNRTK